MVSQVEEVSVMSSNGECDVVVTGWETCHGDTLKWGYN